MMIFDRYAYQNRLVNLNPKIKFTIYLIALGISFSGIPSWQGVLLLVMIPFTVYVGRVNLKTYLTWLLLPFPFVFISLVTILLSFTSKEPDGVLWQQFLGFWYVSFSRISLEHTIALLFRVYGSLVSTYFFVVITPFRQILEMFQSWRFPREFLEVMALMYRFIFMFLNEWMIMRDTLDLKFGFGRLRKQHLSLALLAKQLFTRLVKANDELVTILTLRFDGLEEPNVSSRRD